LLYQLILYSLLSGSILIVSFIFLNKSFFVSALTLSKKVSYIFTLSVFLTLSITLKDTNDPETSCFLGLSDNKEGLSDNKENTPATVNPITADTTLPFQALARSIVGL